MAAPPAIDSGDQGVALARGHVMDLVGHVQALWRYPVKSMLGERLQRLEIGESLVLHVDGGCPRCVITTLAQGSLPESLEILRATTRHNRVTAGIRLTVVQPGPLALGDPVRLEPR